MLVGLFVRHYKTYRAINFIPIGYGTNFSAFIGPNGIGKSSILDALDKFFNGGDWSVNLQAKSDGGISGDDKAPYIVPVFLVEKGTLNNNEGAGLIGEYLWNTKYKTVEALSGFYDLRQGLIDRGFVNTHDLIALGRLHNRSSAYLGSFGSDTELSGPLKSSNADLNELLQELIERYAYFYIPVEADSSHFSALESRHVQKLLDEDIRAEIQRAIGNPNVFSINSSLNNFLSQINASLKSYEYKGSFKNRLTMNDLVEKVFEAYFSTKILHGKNDGQTIPIRDMSAGEKRRALLDLAFSLLERSAKRSHHVILAIDEPDASLHASACYDQFARISSIPPLTNPQTQVLITSHWYGFLPIMQQGSVHALTRNSDRIGFLSFDLYNYREQIKQAMSSNNGPLALDVELKSYNDMLQAIVSSTVKNEPYNWILCEGVSDKIYLEYYFRDLIDEHNLRIIPLGGFKEVRRAYEYLWRPLNDPQYKLKGKVICLVDTDEQQPTVERGAKSDSLDFLRIIFDTSLAKVTLVPIDDQRRSPATEIEHALNAEQFLETVALLPPHGENVVLRSIVEGATMNLESDSMFGRLDLGFTASKRLMTDFFDIGQNKVEFAKFYTTLSKNEVPAWVVQLREYILPVDAKSRSK